jgi:hypothetical protein
MSILVRIAAVACASACSPAAVQPSPGTSGGTVSIDASPDAAWIFVDGRFVGHTPVAPIIPFTHATRYVEVVAVPMHESQARQVLRIVPPSLPRRLQFFMDNQEPQAIAR